MVAWLHPFHCVCCIRCIGCIRCVGCIHPYPDTRPTICIILYTALKNFSPTPYTLGICHIQCRSIVSYSFPTPISKFTFNCITNHSNPAVPPFVKYSTVNSFKPGPVPNFISLTTLYFLYRYCSFIQLPQHCFHYPLSICGSTVYAV